MKKDFVKILSVFIIIVLFTNTDNLIAQTYSISGIVTDLNLKPIPGVNVVILNTNIGTASDLKGNYRISGLKNGIYTLEFSSIGYKKLIKENIAIQNQSIVLNIELKESVIQSEEVLVTAGKYEQKKIRSAG